ncbi:hypothetical protein ACLOJK_024672 [Asimina triloba]
MPLSSLAPSTAFLSSVSVSHLFKVIAFSHSFQMQLSLLSPPSSSSSSSLENMEFSEEVMGTTAHHEGSFPIAKGKRSKRQRLLLPMTSSSSTGCGSDDNHLPSPAHSDATTTEEDEDMANCLILLAQGQARDRLRSEAEAAVTTGTPVRPDNESFYVYECKTCNRCFPSFQALGGHRASHTRPKPAEEKKILEENRPCSPLFNKQAPHNKSRVHECSICGAEFSSGQALGGHMRRHRTVAMAEAQDQSRKQRSILELDLNLPAPEEDGSGFVKSPPRGFSFTAAAVAGKHQLGLTTPTLKSDSGKAVSEEGREAEVSLPSRKLGSVGFKKVRGYVHHVEVESFGFPPPKVVD